MSGKNPALLDGRPYLPGAQLFSPRTVRWRLFFLAWAVQRFKVMLLKKARPALHVTDDSEEGSEVRVTQGHSSFGLRKIYS